jgi:tetratricopeptide (TPR) repeat protein
MATFGLAVGVFEYWEYRVALPRALRAGDHAAAAAILDRLAWFGYDRAQRRRDLGTALVNARELEAARAQFARSLELAPSGEVSALLGWVEERLGNSERAEALYREALAQNVRRADILHSGLARLALADGRSAEAIDHYREAARINPRAEGYRNQIARLLAADPAADAGAPPLLGGEPDQVPR